MKCFPRENCPDRSTKKHYNKQLQLPAFFPHNSSYYSGHTHYAYFVNWEVHILSYGSNTNNLCSVDLYVLCSLLMDGIDQSVEYLNRYWGRWIDC